MGRGCEVFTSDLRVRVAATGLATYPDVSVVCGALQRDPEDPSTVTNPVVLVEVSSDSTAQYDRGEKLEHYRQIASLREILLVSHRAAEAQLWRRNDTGSWSCRTFRDGERVRLESLGAELAIDELYENLPGRGNDEA